MKKTSIVKAIELLDTINMTSKPTITLNAFCLRVYGYSNHEIGRQLDVDAETVRQWILKLKKLSLDNQRIILHGSVDYYILLQGGI